jgi:phosphatidylserine decarboxylase
VSDRLAVLPQYLIPKQALTMLMGHLAGKQAGSLTTSVIRWFIQRYQVNMQEAANPDPAAYATFNEFFTRPLREGARPLSDSRWICPVDGAVGQIGPIAGDQIFQAKGHHYSSQALLGGDAALASQFDNGHFATIYLSPRDYHRIHMPQTGRLLRMIYVPGICSRSTHHGTWRAGLFARNERVVCIFEGAQGPFALVLVGATIVGSMATVWHGVVNPPRTRDIRDWRYETSRSRCNKARKWGAFCSAPPWSC